MKKSINLFTTRRTQSTAILLGEQGKIAGTVVGIILFFIFMVFMFLQLSVKRTTALLQAEKIQILQNLVEDKNNTAKLSYLAAKDESLKKFLKNDAEFLPYYNMLKDVLAFSSESPILDTMTLDKNKSTEFVVRFSDYKPAYEFLRFIESETFLSNFEVLKLNNFSLSQESAYTTGGYELRFQGKFKDITTTKDVNKT
jgi:hypothetical protein